MEQPPIPEQHVLRNRAVWDRKADEYAIAGERNWRREPHWGIWGISDAEIRILPEVAGRDVIELGCGTAYISSWLARRGARVTGIDNSPRQLATASRLQEEHNLHFPTWGTVTGSGCCEKTVSR